LETLNKSAKVIETISRGIRKVRKVGSFTSLFTRSKSSSNLKQQVKDGKRQKAKKAASSFGKGFIHVTRALVAADIKKGNSIKRYP
jgi:hypothetical protein